MFEEGLTIMANLGTEGFKKGTKEIERAVKGLAASAKRFGTQMMGTFRRLIPMIIGVGSAYGIISKGVSAFMAENEQLSQRMSAIWTAVGNLLGPIITQIIDWVSTAVSYFISFLNLLGITNKTASELSKKAKKNAGDLQRTIAGFDELNVLQDNSGQKENPLEDKEPSEWMKQLAELLRNKMWDEAADIIVAKMNELINRFREKAYELGQIIGEYVGGAMHILARIIKDVDWQGLGDGIARFVNGLLENIDGKDLGTIIVGKFVIAFGILTGFLANLDWEAVADFLIDTFIGMFDTVADAIEKADFQKIGEGIRKFLLKIWERKDELAEAVFNCLKAIWEAALDLLNRLLGGDENNEHPLVTAIRNLGDSLSKLAETISPIIDDLWHNVLEPAIDWVVNSGLPVLLDRVTSCVDNLTAFLSGDIGLAEFIGRFYGELVGFTEDILLALNKLLEDLTGLDFMGWATKIWDDIKAAWGNIKEWWHEVAFEDGKFCIEGLFDGILEKVKGIGTWIREKVIDPFVKGFKDGFKIESPSKVMMDIGRYILQGLIDGIKELLPNLDTIKQGIADAWDGLKNTVSGWWDSVKGWFSGADKTAESADGMETSLNNADTAASNSAAAITQASAEYSAAYSTIATSASEAATAVETSVTKIKDDTINNFEEMISRVETESEILETTVTNSFEQLASFASVWGTDLMSNFLMGINAMIPALQSTLIGIANMVNSYIGFSKPEKGPLSDFDKYGPDMMELFAEGIKGGEGDLINALNDIADTVSVRAPGMAGGALLPYGVAAASGGSDTTAAGDDSYERLIGAIDSLENALIHNQWVIDFGNFRAVAKELTRVQRQMSRAEGV